MARSMVILTGHVLYYCQAQSCISSRPPTPVRIIQLLHPTCDQLRQAATDAPWVTCSEIVFFLLTFLLLYDTASCANPAQFACSRFQP